MVSLTDHLDITTVVDWDVKQQNKQAWNCPCFSDENLAYNAFLYHDDQDTRMANELKTKLEEQDFVVYLSSDAPPNKRKEKLHKLSHLMTKPTK